MSSKLPDFESLDYDSSDVVKEDARVDAWEARHDADREQQQAAALHTAAVQEAVSQCLDSCLACLDVLYLQRDAQPFSEIAIAHNSWQQEAEPAPCSRDAWLRGALPETVVPARAASAASNSQTAARSSAGKEQRLRPGSGLLSRKGPGSVASSAAADASAAGGTSAQQRRMQIRPQQSRRTSVANSVQSMKVAESPAAAGTTSGPSTGTVQRPGSGAAGTPSRPSTAQHTTAGNTADAPATPGVPSDTHSTQPATAAAEAAKSPAAAQQASTSRKQAGRPSHLTPDQQEAEDRLRQELQLRRQQEQVIKELKQKDEAARAALLSMQKDLKGKDYTYDSRGKVVLLAKVNPEALPAPPGPQFKVQLNTTAAENTAGNATAAAGAAGATIGAVSSTAASSSGTKAGATAAASGSANKPTASTAATISSSNNKATAAGTGAGSSPFYMQQASRTQPPLLQSLKPAAGVTLKVGGAAKQGPKRDTAAQQQTRTQYQQQAKALNQQTARAAAGVSGPGAASRHAGNSARASSAANPALRPGSSNSSAAGPAGSAPTAAAGSNGGAAAGGSSGSRGSSASSSSSATAAAAAARASAASGATKVQAAAATGPSGTAGRASSSAAGAAAAGAAAAGVAADYVRNSSSRSGPDINLMLVNAPDWGAVGGGGGGAVVPPVVDVVKPSDRQLQEEFGRTTHLPKSRAPVATLKPPKSQPPSTSRLSQMA